MAGALFLNFMPTSYHIPSRLDSRSISRLESGVLCGSIKYSKQMNSTHQNIIGIIRATGLIIPSLLLLLLVGSLKLSGLIMA